MLIPMYVFTILMIPILYLFHFYRELFGLYVHAGQLQKILYLFLFELAFTESGYQVWGCLEAQDAVAHYDPFLDQCADPPVRLDYCLSQQWCTG